MSKKTKTKLPVIGWREWVSLPDLGVLSIKAKVDTGARSSSIHVFGLKEFERDGQTWVRFGVYPNQRNRLNAVEMEVPVLEFRSVRSSSGKASIRPVILTQIKMMDETWPIEVTLARRDNMGFRMLLGREAFRGRFLVDASHSYYGEKPARKTKTKSNL